MMRCHDLEKSLSEYIDGVLSDEKVKLVEQHLLKCPQCREVCDSMKEIAGYMAEMERVDPPADFAKSINARLGGKPSFSGALRRMLSPVRIRLPLELAGVAAAVVLIFYVAQFNLREKVADDQAQPARAEVGTPEAEEMKGTKEDGEFAEKRFLDEDKAEKPVVQFVEEAVVGDIPDRALGEEKAVDEENSDIASGDEIPRTGKETAVKALALKGGIIRQPRRMDIESLRSLVDSLGGNILDVQPPGGVSNPDSTSIPVILTIEIPVKNHERFLLELDRFKSTRKISAEVTGVEGDFLKIRLEIEDISS